MLSSVLKSKRAIDVNITIMQAFVKMREMMATSKEFSEKLKIIESKLVGHDEQFKFVFDAIRPLLAEEDNPKRKIGF